MWRFDIAYLSGSTDTAADAASQHPATPEFFATISDAERDSLNCLEEALFDSLRQNTLNELTLNWDEIARHTVSDAALNVYCLPYNQTLMLTFRRRKVFVNTSHIATGFISLTVLFYTMIVLLFRRNSAIKYYAHYMPPIKGCRPWNGVHAQPFSGREGPKILTFHNIRNSCAYCNQNAPSQAATPSLPSHLPIASFEKIFADYSDYAGRHFLIVGDRLSGWSDVFGTPAGSTVSGANALLFLLRPYVATFGVPEEISSDGGPEFTAFVTQDFMCNWDIKHSLSFAYFPNPTAVKAAKRLLMSNISPNGDLNNDSFLRALLQLRNIPDPDCDLSPAESIFGHPLRDAFSFVNRLSTFSNRFIRSTWREAWRAKEDPL